MLEWVRGECWIWSDAQSSPCSRLGTAATFSRWREISTAPFGGRSAAETFYEFPVTMTIKKRVNDHKYDCCHRGEHRRHLNALLILHAAEDS